MKKIQYILAATLLLGFLFSCKHDEPKKVSTEGMQYPVTITLADPSAAGKKMALRADETSNSPYKSASYAWEKEIKNLTILVFGNNKESNMPDALEMVIKSEDISHTNTDYYGGDITFDLKRAGTFHLEIIANGYNDTNKDEFFATFAKRPITYQDFQKIILKKAVPTYEEKTGFTMLSTDPVKVIVNKTDDGKGTPCDISSKPIVLRRLAARFDVYNTVENLEITSIELKNQVTTSYVLTQQEAPAESASQSKTFTNGDPCFKEYTSKAGVIGMYSYENPKLGATTMEIKGSYKGKTFTLPVEFKKNKGDITIQRNHIYRVYLSAGKGNAPEGGDDEKLGITYRIEVMDWNEGVTFENSDYDWWNDEQNVIVEYVFSAVEMGVSEKGGTSTIVGKRILHRKNADGSMGEVIDERPLSDQEFKIEAGEGNTTGLTVDDTKKSFTIAAGDEPASYKIKVTPITTDEKPNDFTSKLPWDKQPKEVTVFRMLNPLKYVTETCLAENGTSFMKDHSVYGTLQIKGNVSDLDKYKNMTINGEKYHLPTYREMCAIVPRGHHGKNVVYVKWSKDTKPREEKGVKVRVNKKDYTIDNEYQGDNGTTCYAIRFKGTALRSAWRYRYFKDGGNFYGLEITTCNTFHNESLDDIMKSNFWAKSKDHYITRYFPAVGRNKGKNNVGDTGHFWTSTVDPKNTTSKHFSLYMQNSYVGVNINSNNAADRSIRLFLGEHPGDDTFDDAEKGQLF